MLGWAVERIYYFYVPKRDYNQAQHIQQTHHMHKSVYWRHRNIYTFEFQIKSVNQISWIFSKMGLEITDLYRSCKGENKLVCSLQYLVPQILQPHKEYKKCIFNLSQFKVKGILHYTATNTFEYFILFYISSIYLVFSVLNKLIFCGCCWVIYVSEWPISQMV